MVAETLPCRVPPRDDRLRITDRPSDQRPEVTRPDLFTDRQQQVGHVGSAGPARREAHRIKHRQQHQRRITGSAHGRGRRAGQPERGAISAASEVTASSVKVAAKAAGSPRSRRGLAAQKPATPATTAAISTSTSRSASSG